MNKERIYLPVIDTADARQAYIAGVRAACDALASSCRPAEMLAVREWLEIDLAQWTSGPPPPTPEEWEEVEHYTQFIETQMRELGNGREPNEVGSD